MELIQNSKSLTLRVEGVEGEKNSMVKIGDSHTEVTEEASERRADKHTLG